MDVNMTFNAKWCVMSISTTLSTCGVKASSIEKKIALFTPLLIPNFANYQSILYFNECVLGLNSCILDRDSGMAT